MGPRAFKGFKWKISTKHVVRSITDEVQIRSCLFTIFPTESGGGEGGGRGEGLRVANGINQSL